MNCCDAQNQFGHLIFKPIAGWTRTNYSNAVSFVPADLLPGYELELRIMESSSFSGSIQAAFDMSWADAITQLASVSNANKPYVILVQKTSINGWQYARGEGIVQDRDGQDFYLNLFVIQVNGRMERIFMVSQLIREKYGDRPCAWKESAQYAKSADNFIYSVQFDDWQSQATASPGGLSGLYKGLRLDGQSHQADYVYFFKNGQVYNSPKMPTQGFDGLNAEAEKDQRVRYWGTYILKDNVGEISMPYGKIPVTINGNTITLVTQNTRHNYVAAESVDGSLLNGSWYFEGDWSPKPAPSILFTDDGKFVDQGALNILNHTTTSYYNITKEPGEGIYSIRDHTINFNYSDGRRIQIAFAGFNYKIKDQHPAQLILGFNEDQLSRR